MSKSRMVLSSRWIATIARYLTGPTDASPSRIDCGLARSSGSPRAEPPISAATASARDAVLPVHLALDLAREEHVGLLERVVVRLGRATELVVDREHRDVVGAEGPIDHHLHRDPAVREDRRIRTGGSAAAGRVADPERVDL